MNTSSQKNLQNPKILQEYMNKIKQLQVAANDSQQQRFFLQQIQNKERKLTIKTSNSPKNNQLLAQFSPKLLQPTNNNNNMFTIQKQKSEKTLPHQKSLNSLRINQIPTPTERSEAVVTSSISNRKLSPFLAKETNIRIKSPIGDPSRKMSYLQSKRISTQGDEQQQTPKLTLKSGSNTPKFTEKLNQSSSQRTVFGSAEIDVNQVIVPKQPTLKGVTQTQSNWKEEQKSSREYQEYNELKKQLNLWFINESKTNSTGGCLQLLEPTLVHNILKLSSSIPINPELRASISARDAYQNTALHYAAKNGNTQLCSALLFKQIEVDPINRDNITPLIMAACYGKDEVILILINAGADINCEDYLKNTALHYAAKNGHKKTVQILLKRFSINTQKKNLEDYRAEDLACNEETKQLFKDYYEEFKKKQQKISKIQIQQAQNELVQKMFQFHSKPNSQTSQKSQERQTEKQDDSMDNDRKKIQSLYTKQQQIHGHTQTPKDFKAASSERVFQLSQSGNSGSTNSDSTEERVSASNFQVIGMIGKGSFGEVYLVQKKGQSNQLYAMKVLHKSRIMKHNLTRYALTERNVLAITSHPFIVKLRYAFQTVDKLFMILDYCAGGDLGELLQKQKRLPEELVRMYLCEILLALEDLHKRDVIFRDLKPDNIVMDSDGHVLLTDFGLSKEGILEPSTGARSFCGSVAYLAPEMLKRCGHGKAVDWYLFGVVMYELLVGLPPYYANNREELFHNIENAPLKIPNYISPEGKSLLKSLLQRNPAKRLGSGKGDAEEIKAHSYFQGVNWTDIYNKKLQLPIPQRKIRINTRMEGDVFEQSESFVETGKEYLKGWSFINPEKLS